MKKKFLASALAASMVGTMFASMPAFAEEESSSAAAEEVQAQQQRKSPATQQQKRLQAQQQRQLRARFRIMMMFGQRSGQMLIHLSM